MASEYAISKQTLTGIADAIREKTETTATMTPGQMPSKIRSINGGGSGGVQSVEVTQIQSTGTKIASIDVDGTSTDLFAPSGGGGTDTSMIADDFSTSVSYYPGNLVVYNGGLYRCTVTHSGAWNAEHFTAVSVADELAAKSWDNNTLTQFYHEHGIQKAAFPWRSGGSYNIGDYATYAGGLYKSLTGVTGSDPSVDTTNWEYLPPVRADEVYSKLDAPATAGTSGQVLKLDSNLDPVWANESGGTVTDVQVNGTSVVSSGVANVPVASNSSLGVVKTQNNYGILVQSTEGRIYIDGANASVVKTGTDQFRPITPNRQHDAVFYGLAKAAGDSTQAASSNAVGTYTDDAKTAIKNMIGVGTGVSVSGTTATVTDLNGFDPLPSGGTAGDVLEIGANGPEWSSDVTDLKSAITDKADADDIPVSVVTPVSGSTFTLDPCPITYNFGEKAELTVTVTALSQFHFMFSCPSSAATVLTITGETMRCGDTLEAGKLYEVDIWAGITRVSVVDGVAVT